ncbi:hypothetical protein Ddc_23103 [Ditylenchus destructor]|nr:hypothetical protein Ddc_23103 [Ditylenchus destructor]
MSCSASSISVPSTTGITIAQPRWSRRQRSASARSISHPKAALAAPQHHLRHLVSQRRHLAAQGLGQANLVIVVLAGLGVVERVENHDLEDPLLIQEADDPASAFDTAIWGKRELGVVHPKRPAAHVPIGHQTSNEMVGQLLEALGNDTDPRLSTSLESKPKCLIFPREKTEAEGPAPVLRQRFLRRLHRRDLSFRAPLRSKRRKASQADVSCSASWVRLPSVLKYSRITSSLSSVSQASAKRGNLLAPSSRAAHPADLISFGRRRCSVVNDSKAKPARTSFEETAQYNERFDLKRSKKPTWIGFPATRRESAHRASARRAAPSASPE